MKRIKPKVLLLGNGILQAFGGESWNAFLNSIKKRDDLSESFNHIRCPEPLKAILLTNDQVDVAMKDKCKTILEQGNISTELVTALQQLLSLDFDYILTTNYTYELEQAAIYPERLTKYKLDKMTTSTTGRIDRKYLLHTYNLIKYHEKEVKIWHIHGEARKPSSTILGHYYYGNTLFEIKKVVDNIRRVDFDNNKEVESWVEAFLYGDIYCLGFGFGLAEFDLWWLLNRKARDVNNTGKMYFYEPEKAESWAKYELLRLMRKNDGENLVDIINLGYIDDKNTKWSAFYLEAVDNIKVKLSESSDFDSSTRKLVLI